MTTMTLPLPDLFLLGGFGTVRYAVSEDDLQHVTTIATVKPTAQERENVAAFIARLRREHGLRRGDTLDLKYENGRLTVAIITRPATPPA